MCIQVTVDYSDRRRKYPLPHLPRAHSSPLPHYFLMYSSSRQTILITRMCFDYELCRMSGLDYHTVTSDRVPLRLNV
jgi:hypothetical protein